MKFIYKNNINISPQSPKNAEKRSAICAGMDLSKCVELP